MPLLKRGLAISFVPLLVRPLRDGPVSIIKSMVFLTLTTLSANYKSPKNGGVKVEKTAAHNGSWPIARGERNGCGENPAGPGAAVPMRVKPM